MAKILYISYDGMTDTLGQAQVLPYLVGLAKKGYEITLLSTEKVENFAQRQHIIQKITDEAGIDWHYINYTKNPPVVSTILDLRKLQQKAYKLHRNKQFDIIHCRSYIAAIVGEGMKRKFNTKFLFDMRGFWADERVDGGLWNTKNFIFRNIYQYFKQKEKSFLENADFVVSLTENAKQEMQTWTLKRLAPIEVIPCCADTDLFNYQNYQNKDVENAENQPQNPLTISYLGSLGTWYMLDEMLLLFSKILQHKPFAKFLFITPDSPDLVLETAKKYNIPPQKIEITRAERKEVPNLLAKTHLSIFFVKPTYSKKASSPTKMGELLGMGLPIIANSNMGDNDFLFEKYPCGLLLKDFSEKTLLETCLQINNLLDMPKNELRNTALTYFSLEKGIEKYAGIYENLLNDVK